MPKKPATTDTDNKVQLLEGMCVMLFWYLKRQLLVVNYIYCHVVQDINFILLTGLFKPARIRKTKLTFTMYDS